MNDEEYGSKEYLDANPGPEPKEVDDRERDVQRALGTSTEYRVTVPIPVKTEIDFNATVHAVSAEDAEEQVRKILKILTNEGIIEAAHRQYNGPPTDTVSFPNMKIDEAKEIDFNRAQIYDTVPKTARIVVGHTQGLG